MLKAKLVVVGGDAKAAEVNLRLPCVIGRGREATLTLPHPLVSRRHCEITEDKGRLVVRDMGALNGTYVNNKRIEKVETLEPNQLLTLGNVTFRAVYELGETTQVEPSANTAVAVATENFSSSDDSNANTPIDTPVVGGQDKRMPSTERSEPEHSKSREVLSEKETVYDDEKSSSDTDKSLPVIEIGDSGLLATIDQSVSVSSLEDLPAGPSNSSFVEGVDFGENVRPVSEESKVELDIDEPPVRPADEGSKLDSFINKLPR